jgi:methionyl-tRNA synthetase
MLHGYGEGGEVGAGRRLELPDNIVSSEFLTMEGQKFSSSRGVVIYVRDVLERYDADALRYFLAIAGPENQDTDFTWAEFVRRNNDELVATWGNLANRSLRLAEQLGGTVPAPGALTEADRAVRATVEAGFDEVGQRIGAAQFKAAITRAMQLAGEVNQYLSNEAPWKLRESDPERAGTIVHTALQCVNNLKLMFAPFLPFSSQRLHTLLGHDDVCAPQPELKRHADPGGEEHTVLRLPEGATFAPWEPAELPVGQALRPPTPLFTKLDPSVADEELARMEEAARS